MLHQELSQSEAARGGAWAGRDDGSATVDRRTRAASYRRRGQIVEATRWFSSKKKKKRPHFTFLFFCLLCRPLFSIVKPPSHDTRFRVLLTDFLNF